MKVPEDLAVTGVDALDVSDWFGPSLTTVRQPFDDAGRIALELLVTRIEGEPVRSSAVAVLPELLIRGSTPASA